MAKSSQRAPPVEPLPPISHLLSTKETHNNNPSQSLTGKDITKPRDLYTFLSLGHLPVHSLNWSQNETSGNAADDKRDKISLSTITASSKQWEDPSTLSQHSYVQFDAHNPITGLPVLPAITRVSSATCHDEEDEERNDFFDENHQIPRKSIINEDDYKINITTTYIFVPNERLHETTKYNRNVALPKIKPKRNPTTTTTTGNVSQSDAPLRNQKNTQNSSSKDISPEKDISLSPRKATNMNPGNSLFGMRPECIFMNNQLGERNPLLRNTKESPTQQVPKAGQGLNDLKDYDEYPDVYWKLRDGTITQPEDLEADMIDRDLYRLRQISTLKLNTIERTFQVAQDPFRKWRGKTGEPVFSPRQQQRPCNRVRKEKTKSTEIPTYPQHLLKPIAGAKPPFLHLLKNSGDKKNDATPQSTYRAAESSRLNQQHDATPDGKELEISLRVNNDLAKEESPAEEATPRDMLAASLDTYRRLEDENTDRNDLSIKKIHKLKGKKEKKAIKTSLIEVDLDSVEVYKREHRAAPRRQLSEPLNGRSLNNSINRESLVPTNASSSMMISPKLDTAMSLNDKNQGDDGGNTAKEMPEKPEKPQKPADSSRKGSEGLVSKHPIKAPVASILFRPLSERVVDAEAGPSVTVAHFYNDNPRPEFVSPSANVSDGSSAGRERLKNGNPPLRAVHLEVFAERRGPQSPIKIPTGRTTYHPKLPSCKLDLVNYPPSNARQSCGMRSNSASYLEGRQTTLTRTTEGSRQRLESSEVRTTAADNQSSNPPRTGTADNNAPVNIRFGGQGQVIVTSSRESCRRSR